jgi:Kef-type K+ transport system membrane component KefB
MDLDYSNLLKIIESNSLSTKTIIFLGVILVLSFLILNFMKKVKMPAVVGYVFLGILISPKTLIYFHMFPHTFFTYHNMIRAGLDFIPDLALAFVAFIIGYELRIDILKKQGKSILIIVILESVSAFFLVFVGMNFFISKFWPNLGISSLPISLILGAVASATAPAATVMVLKEYHSHGPLTSTILSVVGMDDAAALMIYSFAAPTAMALLTKVSLSPSMLFVHSLVFPLVDISLALGLGFISGIIWLKVLSISTSKSTVVLGVISSIIFNAGVAEFLHISPLLFNMAAGFATSNFMKKKIDFDEVLSIIMEPLYALLFVISGMKLDVGLFGNGIFVAASFVYLITRITGKVSGASMGAILGHAAPPVKKYIGFGLMSQVGVAIALAYQVERQFRSQPILGNTVFNILLFTTIFTELIGPVVVKKVIFKAHEAQNAKPNEPF